MPTVLIVDDRSEIRALLQSVVERDGHTAVSAEDAAAARALLEGGLVPNLIIADYGMPNETGFDFVKKLRTRAMYAHIPVVFVTAHAELVDAKTLGGIGAVEVLSKPFRFEQISKLLRAHL